MHQALPLRSQLAGVCARLAAPRSGTPSPPWLLAGAAVPAAAALPTDATSVLPRPSDDTEMLPPAAGLGLAAVPSLSRTSPAKAAVGLTTSTLADGGGGGGRCCRRCCCCLSRSMAGGSRSSFMRTGRFVWLPSIAAEGAPPGMGAALAAAARRSAFGAPAAACRWSKAHTAASLALLESAQTVRGQLPAASVRH